MRGSQANGVPLDNDQEIEGFSVAVVWRGSFCDEAAGDRVENLHSRPGVIMGSLLRGHAAADHTALRARQGRGGRAIRRRVSRECAGGRRAGGSVIPHACAIRALMIAMIEATLRTLSVSATGGRDRAAAAGGITTRAEIDALHAQRIAAVVGMAIYTGSLALD